MWEVKRSVVITDNGRQAKLTVPRDVVKLMGWSGRKVDAQLVAKSGRIELKTGT